jgi:hypothetical protein
MTDFRDAEPEAFFRLWLNPSAVKVYGPEIWADEVRRRALRSELIRLAGECYRETKGD